MITTTLLSETDRQRVILVQPNVMAVHRRIAGASKTPKPAISRCTTSSVMDHAKGFSGAESRFWVSLVRGQSILVLQTMKVCDTVKSLRAPSLSLMYGAMGKGAGQTMRAPKVQASINASIAAMQTWPPRSAVSPTGWILLVYQARKTCAGNVYRVLRVFLLPAQKP